MQTATDSRGIRNGFHPTFWVANGMELFERLAYYGQATVLSIFLRNHLHLSEIEAGQISSVFGGLIYLLPIVGGALADKFGFRRAFSIAFALLAVGYFLIGSTGLAPFSSWYEGFPIYWVLFPIVILTAIGGSFIKPSVLGTVAVTTNPETKSLGYAIYYWIVNIGAALGPLVAYMVRDRIGIEYVYLVSAASCAAMLIVNLVLYREVKQPGAGETVPLPTVVRNLLVVLRSGRFMAFLMIFALYWLIFWQIFIVVPFYITDYISADAPFEIIMSVGAWGIIVLQLPINRFTKTMRPSAAILTGFAVSSFCWLIVAAAPTIPGIIAGILVFSVGEMMQAPRYYEYISDLAPPGQQGLFQGYAFLPIAVAWGVGGTLGGWLYATYAREGGSPVTVFLVIFGIGVAATLLMALYNRLVHRHGAVEKKP